MKHSRLCVCLVTLAILLTATRGFSGQQDKERPAQPGARSEDRITREVRHELVMCRITASLTTWPIEWTAAP